MTIDRTRRIELLRRWSRLMDSAYRVPGTAVRFGWDPIVGLIPGIGDVATSSFAVVILYHALRLGVPRVVLARMMLNTLVDLAAGLVPFAGDVADIAWKSNTRNLALLERHARPGVKASSGDWAVVLLAMTVIGGALALVLVAVGTMAYTVVRPFL
ncbi:MAG: DUF4112 domain-containing protein [Vicinamibacterales bacterium]